MNMPSQVAQVEQHEKSQRLFPGNCPLDVAVEHGYGSKDISSSIWIFVQLNIEPAVNVENQNWFQAAVHAGHQQSNRSFVSSCRKVSWKEKRSANLYQPVHDRGTTAIEAILDTPVEVLCRKEGLPGCNFSHVFYYLSSLAFMCFIHLHPKAPMMTRINGKSGSGHGLDTVVPSWRPKRSCAFSLCLWGTNAQEVVRKLFVAA